MIRRRVAAPPWLPRGYSAEAGDRFRRRSFRRRDVLVPTRRRSLRRAAWSQVIGAVLDLPFAAMGLVLIATGWRAREVVRILKEAAARDDEDLFFGEREHARPGGRPISTPRRRVRKKRIPRPRRRRDAFGKDRSTVPPKGTATLGRFRPRARNPAAAPRSSVSERPSFDRLHGISTSWPRHRRDSPPKKTSAEERGNPAGTTSADATRTSATRTTTTTAAATRPAATRGNAAAASCARAAAASIRRAAVRGRRFSSSSRSYYGTRAACRSL